jgi:hypothetical protein
MGFFIGFVFALLLVFIIKLNIKTQKDAVDSIIQDCKEDYNGKKSNVEVKVGQIWKFVPEDPFNSSWEAEVLTVKEGYVQYINTEFPKNNKELYQSNSIINFKNCFILEKEETKQ